MAVNSDGVRSIQNPDLTRRKKETETTFTDAIQNSQQEKYDASLERKDAAHAWEEKSFYFLSRRSVVLINELDFVWLMKN